MQDPQSEDSYHHLAIKRVGVCQLRQPVNFCDLSPMNKKPIVPAQTVAANWRIGTSLTADKRGTHMSRLIEELQKFTEAPVSLDDFGTLAERLRGRLGAEEASVAAEFVWFRSVKAPVSGRVGLLDIEVKVSATCILPLSHSKDGTENAAQETSLVFLTVRCPVTSLCPCSKAISDRGAHNQRSYVTITAAVPVHADQAQGTWKPTIEVLAQVIEKAGSAPVYPVLKREDEKFVTEYAYDHPVFVECLVRNTAAQLLELSRTASFEIKAVNLESIHAHDCYAEICIDPNGYLQRRSISTLI